MVLFATYQIFNDAEVESNFNALATGLSLLPFFLLSALSGQLADTIDKAKIIRLVKTAEILIMLGGRSEEHTSELQSLMRISYAVFCLKKKKTQKDKKMK